MIFYLFIKVGRFFLEIYGGESHSPTHYQRERIPEPNKEKGGEKGKEEMKELKIEGEGEVALA